jgi:soluble lytic murein transglycosylase-like protein
VLATALKESCWRQFVVKSDKITYLSSPSGSIGLMQINPYVWRGFYKLDQLKWNIHYNVVAGSEILSHYLLNYAIKSEKTNNLDNIARAAYAIYNAGPGAAGRYRQQSSSSREKEVDKRFWEIYQGFKANDEVDLFHCTVG